ncbi:SDR family NAD(P)-dependent oxidoreductase [Nostocaceae cyanobacterium CENA369]|uniref:SDR family NAD(P)-dependent oxidoreductase n=1 Tax=Dendronalium phyllosphericum CENA369 TaxID=1725256 RepID=A0A8J7I1D8_9NOST|nr:SDR family NAD(P)-dependent oxidoreductase [Dendronalium phyllosphericum]MBH8574200.1 SDR family NAD(P)-dependent oxidoreductase [Dendronalium phyllosphericum CENA369]
MTTLKGKTVLLTGASRGLGVYLARALAREQATIVCISRSKSKLDVTCEEIKALGGQGISIPFDMQNLTELPVLVQHIQEFVAPVDILINNAGIEIHRAFADYSREEIQAVLTTNLLSAMELTRLLLPSMEERGSGRIINIASLAGKKGVAYNSIYSASKAGLIMWTDAMRQELAGTGIYFSSICPGYVSETGMTADSHIPAPALAGTSTPMRVVNAVIKAIKHNKAEVIVNENLITEAVTKLMFAIGQISPTSVDRIYRLLGVAKLNKRRAENWTPNRRLEISTHHK